MLSITATFVLPPSLGQPSVHIPHLPLLSTYDPSEDTSVAHQSTPLLSVVIQFLTSLPLYLNGKMQGLSASGFLSPEEVIVRQPARG